MMLPKPPLEHGSWNDQHGLSGPFQHVAGTVVAARTTDPVNLPVSSGRAQALSSTASTTTYHDRRATERAASSSSATGAQGSVRGGPCEAMPTPRTNEDVERSWISSWWPAYNDDLPPPHTRSMYWTIPLPQIDELDSLEAFEACASSGASPVGYGSSPPLSSQITPPLPPPRPNPNPSHFPVTPSTRQHVRLHPILEGGCSLSHAPTSTHNTAPATIPSVDHITAMIASTGELIQILPSSPIPPYTVTLATDAE
ncbi:hypothetical protein E4T56_gene12663 [Termitomyces sp. T112]|nr:hypothetical protein E4T56_gene12663 [Termitomyces sp. T112]